MFFEIFDQIIYFLGQVWDGGRSGLRKAVAHAPPARRGARSTPRGYAFLESQWQWLPFTTNPPQPFQPLILTFQPFQSFQPFQ